MRDSLLLLSNFIKNPKEVGAVAPSSKFLAKEIVNNIDFKSSKNIVELGPGLGTFTKLILKKALPISKVICFEINGKFCDYLKQNIADSRLFVANSGAEHLSAKLEKLGIKKVDCIISGLPFRNFSHYKKIKILKEVRDSLSDSGRFVLFQYTTGLGNMLKLYFSRVESKFVALNVPPSIVYVCEK